MRKTSRWPGARAMRSSIAGFLRLTARRSIASVRAAARWCGAAGITIARRSRRASTGRSRGCLSHDRETKAWRRRYDKGAVPAHSRRYRSQDHVRRLAAGASCAVRTRIDANLFLFAHDREQGPFGARRGGAGGAPPPGRQFCLAAAGTIRDKDRLAVGARAQVLAVRCLHEAEGQPFAIEDRLINLQAVPEALREDFSTTPPNTWLVGHVPWTEAEHRITACNADKAAAEDLKIEEGAACLVIERRTWRNGDPITAVRLTHPGHLYDLIARFTPTG